MEHAAAARELTDEQNALRLRGAICAGAAAIGRSDEPIAHHGVRFQTEDGATRHPNVAAVLEAAFYSASSNLRSLPNKNKEMQSQNFQSGLDQIPLGGSWTVSPQSKSPEASQIAAGKTTRAASFFRTDKFSKSHPSPPQDREAIPHTAFSSGRLTPTSPSSSFRVSR